MNRPYYGENYFKNMDSKEIRNVIANASKHVEECKAEQDAGTTYPDKFSYDTFIAQWRMSAELVVKGKKELVQRARDTIRSCESIKAQFPDDTVMCAAMDAAISCVSSDLEQYS